MDHRTSNPFVAGGLLLALAAACGGGQATDGGTSPAAVPDAADPPSAGITDEGDAATAPPAPVASPAQPAPAQKTAGQLAQEQQEGLDTQKRRDDARAALARYAAVEVEYSGMVATIPGDALFAPQEATLLPSSQPLLTSIANALLVADDRNLVVESYADASGPAEGAVNLSRARAEAVQAFLVAQGYPAGRIRAKGIGQDHPVATNASPAGRAKNRRVEILVSFDQEAPFQGGAR